MKQRALFLGGFTAIVSLLLLLFPGDTITPLRTD